MTPVELMTKRKVPAQILICNGCCCGRTEKGHPPVPVDWLKQEFKARKLLRKIHLTIAGCLGPCDTPNVVCINFAFGSRWFGLITEFWQYEAILDWASACAESGALLPLPSFLAIHEMEVLLPAASNSAMLEVERALTASAGSQYLIQQSKS
jgi:hypothetical protein